MGYLNKQESNEKLLEAIHAVLNGDRYVSPEITRRLVAQALGSRGATDDPIDRLTDRELEIFRMIGKGLTTRQIAEKLHLSHKTIEGYRENIKAKLNLKNGAEVNLHAIQWVLENKSG